MIGLVISEAVLCVGLTLIAVRIVAARRRPVAPVAAAPAVNRPPFLPALSSLVVEALDTGVVVLDAQARVVLVNPAARAMEIVDVDRLAFESLVEVAERARDSDSPVTDLVDLPLGRMGRSPIGVAVTALRITEEDREDAIALMLTDVSEQRRLDAVRRDFVANVSHELKTPVGALSLLAEAVQDAAGDQDAVERFAGRMQHEATRLNRLVKELMELSRVQGVDPMPGAAEVDVSSLVTDAVDRERMAAEQLGIDVEVRCDPSLLVRGNRAQLAGAVANLVDNAIAYSAGGTRIAVTARKSTDHQARPTVDIAVTDQGLGISDEDQHRIFERFYRVDPARSRATGGTGLGLAIVRNVVTNHRGTVTVRSAIGAGSTFTIRLPRVHSTGRRSVMTTQADRLASSTEETG